MPAKKGKPFTKMTGTPEEVVVGGKIFRDGKWVKPAAPKKAARTPKKTTKKK